MRADAAGRRATLTPGRRLGFRIRRSDGAARRRGPYDPLAGDLAGSVSGAAQRARDGAISARRSNPAGLDGEEHRSRHGGRVPRIGNPRRRGCGCGSWRRLDSDRGRPDRCARRQDLVRARRRRARPRRPQRRPLQPVAGRKAGLVRGPGRNLEAGANRGARSGSPERTCGSMRLRPRARDRRRERNAFPARPRRRCGSRSRASGQAVARHDVPLRSAEFEARLEVAKPDPWSPDSAQALRSRGRARP